ncbi:MAG: SUMF1/EgtB/PvdO family nonheme iron enzyme [Rhodocyclaceae bacterium]|nr:SUMF1/EgtB/PvdO family nonheme iron enzyme [Rhodocyclaceae bacterium]
MLRGGSWNNHPQNCRAANRNNNSPDNRNNNIGFRVCRGSHIVSTPGPAPARAVRNCRPTTVCRPRPGGKTMAQARPVRTRRHRVGRRVVPGAAWIRSRGAHLQPLPACLIQPPSSLPISATMPLTCWYCPSLNHAQRCARRRYRRNRSSAASASASACTRCSPRALRAANTASWQSSAASARRRVTVVR